MPDHVDKRRFLSPRHAENLLQASVPDGAQGFDIHVGQRRRFGQLLAVQEVEIILGEHVLVMMPERGQFGKIPNERPLIKCVPALFCLVLNELRGPSKQALGFRHAFPRIPLPREEFF